MNGSKEKSHGGNRGFSDCADIEDGSGAENIPSQVSALFLASVAISEAQAYLDAYALTVDDPPHGIVEAADLLDAAEQRLAEFSDAVKGGCE